MHNVGVYSNKISRNFYIHLLPSLDCMSRFIHYLLIQCFLSLTSFYFFTEKVIFYICEGDIVAAGHLMSDISSVHGYPIPADYVCVKVIAAKENRRAPLTLGDETENSFLEKDKFFALPKKSLTVAKLLNQVINLVPLY